MLGSLVFVILNYISLYNATQDLEHELRLAQRELERLNKKVIAPMIMCGDLQLEVIAQNKLNDTLQEQIIHLEKLEHICQEEELEFQSLNFRIQELEEDCKCR